MDAGAPGRGRRLQEPVTEDGPPELSPARIETLLEKAGMRRQVSAMQPLTGQGILISFDDVNFADLLRLFPGCRMKALPASPRRG